MELVPVLQKPWCEKRILPHMHMLIAKRNGGNSLVKNYLAFRQIKYNHNLHAAGTSMISLIN